MATKKTTYYFTTLIPARSGLVPDNYELFEGAGATPELALEAVMDEYDLEPGKSQQVFYFTLANNEQGETGILTVTRTGLKIERA
jgi:hypothetical protein